MLYCDTLSCYEGKDKLRVNRGDRRYKNNNKIITQIINQWYAESIRLRHQFLPDDEISARVEAALYSAGRPLSIDDLVRASGTNSKEKIRKIVNDLIRKTNSVFKAIEITQLEEGTFVFQVKAIYTPLIRRFAQQPIISSSALKTLSYIAYEQPITSKRLVQIRGNQVYNHLKELQHISFIEYEKLGRLKIYRTTKNFQDYFGVTDINSIKNKLELTKPKSQ